MTAWHNELQVVWDRLSPSLKKKFTDIETSASHIAIFGKDQEAGAKISVSKYTPANPVNNSAIWIDTTYRIGRAFTENNWEFTRAAWAASSSTPRNPPATENTPPAITGTPTPPSYVATTLDIMTAHVYAPGDRVDVSFVKSIDENGNKLDGPRKQTYIGKNFKITVTYTWGNTSYYKANQNYGNIFIIINSDTFVLPIKSYESLATMNANTSWTKTYMTAGVSGQLSLGSIIEFKNYNLRNYTTTNLLPTSANDHNTLKSDYYSSYPYYFDLTSFINSKYGGDVDKFNVNNGNGQNLSKTLQECPRNGLGTGSPAFDLVTPMELTITVKLAYDKEEV